MSVALKNQVIRALFDAARKKGIDRDYIREVTAPNIISKRLSKATHYEVAKVYEHITGEKFIFYGAKRKRYAKSMDGLREEITDLAKERYGEGWEKKLNALCKRHGCLRWQWLRLAHAKAVKTIPITKWF